MRLYKRQYLYVFLFMIFFIQNTQAWNENQVPNRLLTLKKILIPVAHDESNYYANPFTAAGGSLTITGSGTIRFIQAIFYSDTGCTNFLGAASAIDNVSGASFTSAQTIRLNSSSIYQLANNQSIATENIACMKLFLTGSNQSSQGISCQSFTDISCSGTQCTSAQTKNVTWSSNPTPCGTRYLYVPNTANNTVSKCAINNSSGLLSGCATTGSGFSSPRGIALNNYYAYVVNTGSPNSISL